MRHPTVVSNQPDRQISANQDLTEYVCWSRMQAEAGQELQAIVERKELERLTGDGLFLWGVGNAPAVGINALARLGHRVPVVFSIMKGRPKAVDVAPARTVAWRRFFDTSGVIRSLPPNVIVTSRGDSSSGPKRSHYALICFSNEPLKIKRGIPFDVDAYRNASGTAAPVGASQVTALLRRVSELSDSAEYEVNIEACLIGSYWVRLADPVEVKADLLDRLGAANELSGKKWLDLASDFRRDETQGIKEEGVRLLF